MARHPLSYSLRDENCVRIGFLGGEYVSGTNRFKGNNSTLLTSLKHRLSI